MAQLTAEQVQRTIEACRAHLAEMGDTFRVNLDCDIRLTAEEPRPYAADVISAFDGPGLAVSLVLGEQGLLFLIPEPFPLPAWYQAPGLSENNRLQSFAHELSLEMLPADLQADRYRAVAAASLKAVAERAQIDPSATTLVLPVFHANAAEAEAPVARILVVIPVEGSRLLPQEEASASAQPANAEGLPNEPGKGELNKNESPSLEPASTEPPTDSSELDSDALASEQAAEEEPTPTSENVPATSGISRDEALRALRILNVPVTVSVRLAERKMPLGQIVALVPGALVTFNKSCEDLLDLFVNNHRYCQGEAIKIGENFGLKVAKVGVTEERKEHVL
jgi:flagellar motor switch protein FliN